MPVDGELLDGDPFIGNSPFLYLIVIRSNQTGNKRFTKSVAGIDGHYLPVAVDRIGGKSNA
ncbi:hypothetical protein D3C73_874870 [compost metagenome]